MTNLVRWNPADVNGCLKLIRTADKTARRRVKDDEDSCFDRLVPQFEIDISAKVLPSKASRRLGNKTQVVKVGLDQLNQHIRSRKTHTEDVVCVVSVISQILGLNTSLCRAIAYAHDIGHTPFGHLGERFLRKVTGKDFRHEVFGVVIAQKIERSGMGLNLTRQVLDGILHHSRGDKELKISIGVTPEATAMMYSDKIAYTWSDINDIFIENRTGLRLDDFPKLKEQVLWFGSKQRERIRNCQFALCMESAEKGKVSFQTSEEAQRFAEVKKLMYEVYYGLNRYSSESDLQKVYELLGKIEGVDPAISLALLCDDDVLFLSQKKDLSLGDLGKLSIAEIFPHIQGRNIDFTDPDLNW